MKNSVLRDSTGTVLLVEDEADLRRLLCRFLTEKGFYVLQAGTADAALQQLENNTDVNIVFSDVNMPGTMDGIGLARWLRQHRPEIKVVLASGHAQPDAAELCDGGQILRKPFNLEAMVSRLISLCSA